MTRTRKRRKDFGIKKGPRSPESVEKSRLAYNAKMPSVTARLLARRRISEAGCWEYQGARDGCGYGLIRVGGQLIRSHIVAFRLYVGSTDGFLVCHTCDNPCCFNPEHLWLGTIQDNTADRDRKGRWKDWQNL